MVTYIADVPIGFLSSTDVKGIWIHGYLGLALFIHFLVLKLFSKSKSCLTDGTEKKMVDGR